MQARPECVPCMFRQAINTTRLITDDQTTLKRVLVELARELGEDDFGKTPAGLSQPAYEVIERITGIADPYAAHKRESNALALQMRPHLERTVLAADDPLDAALHLAAAGNIIDAGIGHAYDLEKDVVELMGQPFAISALDQFRTELVPGTNVLYLGDNAGEIVFDTVLVKLLLEAGARVTYTVKSGPIINDATMEDAETAGMTALVPVIETGSRNIGVGFHRASQEFLGAFATADIILGKGHGNFETCVGRPENLYFLLKAKCEIVAAELGVRLGDIAFKCNLQ